MIRTLALQALFPTARYATAASAELLGPVEAARVCERCGGSTYAGSGQRAPVYFAVRDRGTAWRNKTTHVIHRGCIPTDAAVPRGLPARARRASQVRA